MSVSSVRRNRVFRLLLEGVRSMRLGKVEAAFFPASPFLPGDDDGNRLPYGKRQSEAFAALLAPLPLAMAQ
jgi:hypothetical protein